MSIIINDVLKSIYEYNEYTITELLCKFYDEIATCVDKYNALEIMYNKLLNEDLPEEVKKEIDEMYNNGKLESIINEVIFNELSNKLDNTTDKLNNATDRTNVYYLYDICNAIGDGVSDDTTELQKAFDYVASKKGCLVLPFNKTFRTTYSLLIDSNTIIEGNFSIIHYGLDNGVGGSAIVTKSYLGGDICTNIIIKNLGFKCSSYLKNAIGICRASNVVVDNAFGNEVYYHLVDFAAVQDSVIKNCKIAHYEKAPLQVDNLTALGGLSYEDNMHQEIQAPLDLSFNSENITIENNYAYDCKDFIHLHREGGRNILINNNVAKHCGSLVKSDPYTRWVNVTISNNNCVGLDKNGCYGVYTEGYISGLKVINNNFENLKYPLGLRSWVTYSNTTNGFTSINNNIDVSHNTFANIGDRCIALDVCKNVVVAHNNLMNIGSSDTMEEWNLNNAYNYQNSRGIGLFKCSNVNVIGNNIDNCYGNGIMLQGKCDFVIIANNIVTNTYVCLSATHTGSTTTETTDFHITISNNEFWGGSINALIINLVDNEYVKIKDNSIQKTGWRGVYIKKSNNIFIIDNIIKSRGLNEGEGIGIESTTINNLWLKDNIIDGYAHTTRETTCTNVKTVNNWDI